MKGGYYPVGGASETAMRFIPVIEKTGGSVLVRAPVKEILLDEEKGKVRGICKILAKGLSATVWILMLWLL
jgi:all-trans-retinol 13,14-reductase